MKSKKIFGINLDKIQIGMQESYTCIITEEQVVKFAELSGDKNPIHLDEQYASKSRYKKRLVHGLFLRIFFFCNVWYKITWRRMCICKSKTLF